MWEKSYLVIISPNVGEIISGLISPYVGKIISGLISPNAGEIISGLISPNVGEIISGHYYYSQCGGFIFRSLAFHLDRCECRTWLIKSAIHGEVHHSLPVRK